MNEDKDEIHTLKIKRQENIETAKRIMMLIKKEKGLIRKYQRITNFKEPVLFLIRKDRRVEFYEDVTKGTFTFSDENDKDHKVQLNPNDTLEFEYGRNSFKGYILYEEEYMPYPTKPLVLGQLIEDNIDKILADIKKWKLEEERLKLAKWGYIIGGVALIIGGIILYKLLIKPNPALSPEELEMILNASKTAVTNVSVI